MKPLPSADSHRAQANSTIPSIPGPGTVLPVTPGPYSRANRRTGSCPVQRIYPWMLVTSTAVAAVFAMMYITKPVIVDTQPSVTAEGAGEGLASAPLAASPRALDAAGLLPGGDRLPGEAAAPGAVTPADPRRSLPSSPSSQNPFEETNLRIQHVLTAETPGGDLSRIVLDVPVLYQSRELRWTAAEVAEARDLLDRLDAYQEKTRALRDEGTALLDSWNSLVQRSIPTGDLRADSPSLPENQAGFPASTRSGGLDTTEAIQLQPSGQ